MHLCSRRLLALFAIAAVICFAADGALGKDGAPLPGKRLALVVGNGAYHSDAPATAANDAGLVAEALAQDGFAVTALADPDADRLRKAVGTFADSVHDAGEKPLVFVYLSGQGVQYGGANYVVPVDVTIERQAEVPEKAVALHDILNVVENVPAAGRVFVFDLAHANAIGAGEPIQLAPGLRHMQPTPGSIYAFNAAPDMLDRPDLPVYGTYARALAEALRTPGFDVQAIMARARVRVTEATGGAVVPWNNGELELDAPILPAHGNVQPAQIATRSMSGLPVATVYWAAIAEDSLAGYQAFLRAFPNDPLAARVRTMEAVRLEAASWAEACHTDTPAAYWTYMRRYPRGPHYVDVRRRLASIKAALEPPMRFDPSDLGGLPTPSEEQIRIATLSPRAFEDSAWPPIPSAPDELLPPPSPAFYSELAPPPLVPEGALPIPAPLPGNASARAAGPIRQPGLAEIGHLTTEAASDGQGIVVTASSDDGPLTKTTTKLDSGRRTIVQTDAAEEVVSWTTVGMADGNLAITQTGPTGEILSKQVTRAGPDGESSTVVTNGAGRLVAEVKNDRRGRILAVTTGTARIVEPTFVLVPRAQAKPDLAPKQTPPKLPAASVAPPAPASPKPPDPRQGSEKGSADAPGSRSEVKPAPTASNPKHEELGLRGESLDRPEKLDVPPPQPPNPASTPSTAAPPDAGQQPGTMPSPVATAPAVPSGPAEDATPASSGPPLPIPRPASPVKQRSMAAHRKVPLVYMRARRPLRR